MIAKVNQHIRTLTPRSSKSRNASSLAVTDSSCSASRRNDCTATSYVILQCRI